MTPGTGVIYIMVYIIKYLLNKYCTFDDQLVKNRFKICLYINQSQEWELTDLTTGFNKDS